VNDQDETGLGWTVVLRRQPVRMVAGRAEGGYTDAYELVCCECGDDPGLDYREVSAGLRQIRRPYPFAAGTAAYHRRVSRYHRPQAAIARAARRDRSSGTMEDRGWTRWP
jgi:hypothetical protein